MLNFLAQATQTAGESGIAPIWLVPTIVLTVISTVTAAKAMARHPWVDAFFSSKKSQNAAEYENVKTCHFKKEHGTSLGSVQSDMKEVSIQLKNASTAIADSADMGKQMMKSIKDLAESVQSLVFKNKVEEEVLRRLRENENFVRRPNG